MKRLIIATHNRKKAGEMIQILSAAHPSLALLTLADFEGAPEPEETGSTYAENAEIKALSAARFTGEWSLADDAGLEIDALDGAPGVYSKRFAGEETSFPEKIARILDLMDGVPEDKRTARFRCWVALAGEEIPRFLDSSVLDSESGKTGTDQLRHPSPITCHLFGATCEGRISTEPSGNGGFGYDPIFFLSELGCTMADLTADQKHAISHRGKVLNLVSEHLRIRFGV